MKFETNEINYPTLLRSRISIIDTIDQVWKIYNKTVPMTENQRKIRGSRSLYSVPTRTRIEFGDNKHVYKITRESECNERERYEVFKDVTRDDIEKVLNRTCKPLLEYRDSRKTPIIPVPVAATFAAIFDMRKYHGFSPGKMVYSENTVEETIGQLINKPVNYVLTHYDKNDYFLTKMVENLKYFFNIIPEFHETNMGVFRHFNYQFIENGGYYLITKDNKKNYGKIVDLTQNEMLKEINSFKESYEKKIIQQAKIKKKAAETMSMVDQVLESFSTEEVKIIRPKLEAKIRYTFCINKKYDDEWSIVYPIDFTEPEYNVCHKLLTEESKTRFYSERYEKVSKLGKKNREYYETNSLYNEVGLKKREMWLEDMLKRELKKFNHNLYTSREQCIESLRISED